MPESTPIRRSHIRAGAPRTKRPMLVLVLLAFVLIAAACGGDDGEETADTTTTTSTTTTTTTEAPEPEVAVAPLTGLPIEDGDEDLLEQPAIVVKISNNDSKSTAALIGLEQADVVIEERIEDRATRFASVFHTNRPLVLGPVRSGRPADVDIMGNLGEPIMIYSGAHQSVVRALQDFEAEDGVFLIVDNGSGVDLVRNNDFPRPDNLFVDLESINEKYAVEAGVATPIFTYLPDDEERPDTSTEEVGATVRGRDVVSFVYDPDVGYVRVQNGALHQTREGVPLAVDNLVVLETDYTPSSYDPRNVDAHTVGSGPVAVMIGGETWVGTWERETPEDPYTFLDANGDEIMLDPGQTWMTLVPAFSWNFDVDAETTALVLGTDE